MFPTLLPFLLFAFVASITPGPTNILVLSNSARYGLKAALPIVLGACMGAAGIVLLVGSGVGQSLAQLPRVIVIMPLLLPKQLSGVTTTPLNEAYELVSVKTIGGNVSEQPVEGSTAKKI